MSRPRGYYDGKSWLREKERLRRRRRRETSTHDAECFCKQIKHIICPFEAYTSSIHALAVKRIGHCLKWIAQLGRRSKKEAFTWLGGMHYH